MLDQPYYISYKLQCVVVIVVVVVIGKIIFELWKTKLAKGKNQSAASMEIIIAFGGLYWGLKTGKKQMLPSKCGFLFFFSNQNSCCEIIA